MSKWPPRKLRDEWEARLADFGLSENQIRRSDTQEVAYNSSNVGPVAFDSQWLASNEWKWPAQQKGFTMHDLRSTHLIAQRHAPRQVPSWATDDSKVRALLQKKYIRLNETEPGADSRGRKRSGADRRNAARASLIIYYCYRLMWSDEDVAELLGVARITVSINLLNLKKTARELFGEETNATAEPATQSKSD
jgi:hypothetical protein